MEHITPMRSIQGKLGAAFLVVACFVAAFVGITLTIYFETVDLAARLEAQHVAELIGEAVVTDDRLRPDVQEYIVRVNSIRERDIVVVDANQIGLADANPAEIGTRYDHDPDDEVGQTISDGQPRTFIEANDDHPNGAHQVVIPLRRHALNSSEAPIGAVLLEYTSIRKELFDAERGELYVIITVGIALVLTVTLFGLGVARRSRDRCAALKRAPSASRRRTTRQGLSSHPMMS